MRLVVVILLAVVMTAACTSIETKKRDWAKYEGPGAKFFQQEETAFPQLMRDPNEPMNRSFESFNQWFANYIFGPLATGYRFITPTAFRTRLGMAGTNLQFPVRFVNNAFQWKWSPVGTETLRFVINTTVGLLGFFDPADSWGLTAPYPEDTGLTFEKAGWKDPRYINLPVKSSSSSRDAVGLIPDTLLDIAFWIPPLTIVFGFNTGSDLMPKYLQLIETQYDPYRLLHALYTIKRQADVLLYQYEPGKSGAVESLQNVFFKPHDPRFLGRACDCEVEIPSTGKELPYNLWLQDEPAPVIFILPGLGTHRSADAAAALAEIMWDNGYSAVTISSSMNWEFIEYGSSVDLPGFAPADAHDAHVALDRIAADIEQEHPGQMTKKGLFGISLGAFHTNLIAAAEADPDNTLINFDAYISAASPVRLEHALSELDHFYNAPLDWPADERKGRIWGTLMKVLKLAATTTLKPGTSIPLSDLEARFLIGLAFRMTLTDIIFQTQEANNMGVLLTPLKLNQRGPAYDEIVEFSYIEYFYAFAMPYFQARDPTLTDAKEIFWRCNLQSLEPQLAANMKLRLFTNATDFLQSDEDREWARKTFGDRLTIWKHGGHLGNTINPAAHAIVLAAFDELLDWTPPATEE